MTTVTTAPTRRRTGAWRATVRGWAVFVPVVLVRAAAQALLVLAAPVPAVSLNFFLLLLGALAVQTVCGWCALQRR